jgi:hypothetical protein
MTDKAGREHNTQPSCNPGLSRSQFLSLVVEKALLAGTLLAVPAIADIFIAPPAQAQASGGAGTALADTGIIIADTGTQDG